MRRILHGLALDLPLVATRAAERLNVLLIPSEHMSRDSVGVSGCKLKDTRSKTKAQSATARRVRKAA